MMYAEKMDGTGIVPLSYLLSINKYDAKKCIETMGAERITREDGSTIIHYVCHCTFGIDNSIQWCFHCCDKKIINESLVEFFY